VKGLNSPDKENVSSWDPGIKGMGNPSKPKIGFIIHDHQPSPGPSIIFHISYFPRMLEAYCRSGRKDMICLTFLSENNTMIPVAIDDHLSNEPWEGKMEVLS